MARADVEGGRKQGLTSDERKELVQLRREQRRGEPENEILRRAAVFFAKEIGPKWRSGWSRSLPPGGIPVAVACRMLGVVCSWFYEWRSAGRRSASGPTISSLR